MLGNWISETTSTTGTGTISLGGAVSADLLPFSSQFVTGAIVRYDIKDGNNRETGKGTLTSGTPWTLARSTVQATLVAGTYTGPSPTGISLSGSAVVSMDMGANDYNIINCTTITGCYGINMDLTNLVIGDGAFLHGTTGIGVDNVAIGKSALAANTTGYNNIGISGQALISNTSGQGNIAIGTGSQFSNLTGNSNLGIGQDTLFHNTAGSSNIALGQGCLGNTTGSNNVGVGVSAAAFLTSGHDNLAMGHFSLYTATTGNYNTAIGTQGSMQKTTTGGNNTAVGSGSLYYNTTGNNNTVLGYNAGELLTTGSNNTIVGPYLGVAAMAGNVILADGAGNIRYQFDGTNNLFPQPVKLGSGHTVATLPAGVVGLRDYVTDATAPTFLGPLTGGGTVTTPVFYNGTAWVAG